MKQEKTSIQRDPLRIAAVSVAVLAIILLVISTFFQCLAIYSLSIGGTDIIEENGWLIPVWITALVMLPLAAVANTVFKNNEKWTLLPIALGLIGALLALLVALTLRDELPVQAGNNVSLNNEQGLDGWKLTYRHMSSVFAGGLTAIAAGMHRIACRADRIRMENEQYESVYDLGGDPLFADDEKPKMKRSKKDALRKGKA